MRLLPRRRILVPIILLAAGILCVPAARAATSGHQTRAAAPVIEIGRQGGNIRPFTIDIAADGTVTVNGPLQSHGNITIPRPAVKALLKLVKAEKFSALPTHINGTNVNPDVASLFITVQTSTGSKTVAEHGAKNSAFDQLFAVVMAVAQASY